ncbi:CDC45 family protein [Kipferlia bialata]|uniref:CDC45 family protein n=1 Tax=Kipferlia bialata TaxID=797122 RepID=A0A9K3GLU2_9EUKA|nr:CDC45 family protein [Kipferlia bialata]|eukprot:g8902.t1
MENREVSMIIMVNCGVNLDVEHFLELNDAERESTVTFYVFDSARPVHLNNVTSNRVFLLDDGSAEVQLREFFDDEHIDLAASPDRASLTEDDFDRFRAMMEAPGFQSDEYYLRAACGSPISFQMYDLVRRNMRVSRSVRSTHLSWLASIGLTEYHLNHKITDASYRDMIRVLSNDFAVSKDGGRERERDRRGQNREIGAGGDIDGVERGGIGGMAAAGDGDWLHTKVDRLAPQRHRHSDEMPLLTMGRVPRLFLLSLSTLRESIELSSFAGPKMRSWSNRGKSSIALLLSAMGVKIQEADMKWRCLTPSRQRDFRERLFKIAPEFGLSHIDTEGVEIRHPLGLEGGKGWRLSIWTR